MGTGTTIALVTIPVVLVGGGLGAYFLLRKKGPTLDRPQMSGNTVYANQVMPAQALAQVKQDVGGTVAAVGPAAATGGGGGGMSAITGNLKGAAVNVAAKYLNNYIPGLGNAAKGIAGVTDKVMGSTFGKIPGVGKVGKLLSLW